MDWSFVEILVGLVAVSYLLYYYFTRNFDYWNKRQVAGPKPKAFYGTFKDIAQESFYDVEYIKSLYDAYPDEPAVGLFSRSLPVLLLRDPDLIKDVLIKSFHNFGNRGNKFHPEISPLSQHLFFLSYDKWKPLRRKLSPTFTSGKLKEMFYLISDCTENFVDYLEKLSAKNKPVEVREVTAKYTTDVIGACAFGLNMNALADEASDFRMMGRRIFAPGGMNRIRRIVNDSSHWLSSILGPMIRDDEMVNFFVNSIKSTVEYRKKNNVRKNDFIDLLMDIKEHPEKMGDDVEFTDILMTSQAFVFFIAGFETSSTTISNAFYELALNPDIQTKLRDEISRTYEKSDGKMTYEDIKSMKYLDKVFKETLRKYPPVYSLTRDAINDHTFHNKLSITKGTMIIIPSYAIHYNPEIYPDPDKFDPERFDENTIESRPPMSYLPFGDGPRNCIGERFGVTQTKMGLAYAILKFEFQVCEKTPKVYRKRVSGLLLAPKDDLILKINKIT